MPYLTGLNSQESVMFVQCKYITLQILHKIKNFCKIVLDLARPLLAQWDLVPQVLVPDDMNTVSLPERTAAAMRIKQHYFGNRPAAISSREEVLEVSEVILKISF